MHELDSKFKRWAKNDKNTWTNLSRIQSTKSKFNANLEHNVTIIMIKHDFKTTWIKWLTLRFLCFFNEYFGRKFKSKGLAQEDYDCKMIEPKINTKIWFKSISIKFEPLKCKNKCRSKI